MQELQIMWFMWCWAYLCDEYMHNKSHVHAMLAESLEHTFSFSEHDVSIIPSLSPSSPTLLPLSDSDMLLHLPL